VGRVGTGDWKQQRREVGGGAREGREAASAGRRDVQGRGGGWSPSGRQRRTVAVARVSAARGQRALSSDRQRREKRMTGGAQMSVGKIEVQFTQPAGVEAQIWVSKI
jgi:hypothetical protein